ncbi:CoA pyrophosphatase [Dechloromonas sp. A34]|uniref:CoA pyrophosphatase n=1 Tax=Dechloromonas sp. A34 TaxID=447588 RepID=UPI002248A32B|nr:CoA pyrophosphatase [Dechloromonas sp. A34]
MTFDLERLKASLLTEPLAAHFVEEDGAEQLTLTPAAVLFPIVLRDDKQTVLLTQRTAHLRDHAGQISFPGGRVEAEDLSPIHTALRETEEEIGLSRERIEVLGFLPEYRTGTGFRVTPVVALVLPPFDIQPDPFEVAEVFEVPLAFLLDPANHQQHSIHYRGALRQYFAMPYGDYFIWGATAGMIRSLTERLGLHAA